MKKYELTANALSKFDRDVKVVKLFTYDSFLSKQQVLYTLDSWKNHYKYDFVSIVIQDGETQQYLVVKDFTNYGIDIRYLYDEDNKRYRELYEERVNKFLTELKDKLEA